MNAIELLEQLNQLDENERIEAKRGQDAGKSILETICAFANEPNLDGGWLLLGVKAENQTLFPIYSVEGVANPDKVSADVASQCATMFNVLIRPEIKTEDLNGKAVLVIYVPEAAPQDKPIFLKSKGLPRGAFRRIGSTDQRCTEDDLELLYHSRQRESFDAGIVPHSTLDDLDEQAIADYRQTRAESNPDAEELHWSNEDLLQALKAIQRDAQGIWKPTVAGMLLFGKTMALRRCFPMTRVDYIRVPGREWLPDPEHRFDTIELRAPLFSLLRRSLAAVMDDLPKSFGLKEGSLQRQDTPLLPQRALREAIVNALMHRNYRNHSPVQLIRYSNRLEIRNPGFSLKSPEHLGEPGSSPRNPTIASVLHDTRFAETKGSGIRAMHDAMDKVGLLPPLFDSDRSQDLFVAQFFFHHFLAEADLQWLADFKARFKDLQISDEEMRTLVLVRETGRIDNASYRRLNKVDLVAASTGLRRLRDAGLLTQKGGGPATWYEPTNLLLGVFEQPAKDFNQVAAGNDSVSVARNHVALDKSKKRNDLLDKIPGQIAARIGAIGLRHPPEEIRSLIVELCRLHEWRVDDLALILKRKPETVRQDYIRPLLARGLLVMTVPDRPQSPQQAYKSIEE